MIKRFVTLLFALVVPAIAMQPANSKYRSILNLVDNRKVTDPKYLDNPYGNNEEWKKSGITADRTTVSLCHYVAAEKRTRGPLAFLGADMAQLNWQLDDEDKLEVKFHGAAQPVLVYVVSSKTPKSVDLIIGEENAIVVPSRGKTN